MDRLEKIRNRGYSFDQEEQLDGVEAVGVPMTGVDDRVVGSFRVASPGDRLTDTGFEADLPISPAPRTSSNWK